MIKFFTAAILVAVFAFSARAAVVAGSATAVVRGDNIRQADVSARTGALINALYNYFSRQQETSPDTEIPDITSEYFKFIKSYKITERHYGKGTVTYSVIADIDKITLNDISYMIRNVTSSAVFFVKGTDNSAIDQKIAESLKKNSFSTKYQSDFRASVSPAPESQELIDAFKNSMAQYYFEITPEYVQNSNACTVALTAKVYAKDKDYSPLKTNGESKNSDPSLCQAEAAGTAMTKLLGFVRQNYIPLPEATKELNRITVTASNYSNFAAPKNIMEDMKKRTFVTNYAVKGFAEKSLEMEAEMYISPDMLLKKFQIIEKQYGFRASMGENGNIVLDFTGQE